jgi:hypothetical protein
MQHLIIYLADEAFLGDPVQYRWMYPFQRCTKNFPVHLFSMVPIGFTKWNLTCRYILGIKNKVRNKARVEGSIVEAYLVEEATNFLSLYFRSNVHSV